MRGADAERALTWYRGWRYPQAYALATTPDREKNVVNKTWEGEATPHHLWLPGERWEMGLDARLGGVTPPPSDRRNMLMVTSHRAILTSHRGGKRTTSLLPLEKLTGIEVVDVSRPSGRLLQGLLFLGIGLLLGIGINIVVKANTTLFVVVGGGLPTLVGVYLLAAYFFPDQQGELVLHAGVHTVRMPLLSASARRDAHLVAHRLSELSFAATPRADSQTKPEAHAESDSGMTALTPEAPGGTFPAVSEEPAVPQPSAEEPATNPTEPNPTA